MLAAILFAVTITMHPLLPRDAKVVETVAVPASERADRTIILWMHAPQAAPVPCPDAAADTTPSCPDETRGCFLRGRTRLSLVDARTGRIINTLIVRDPYSGDDTFDIPVKVLTPGPYLFDPLTRRPNLLRLRDINGDGKALEFALFDAISCADLFTTLFSYNPKRDALVNYPIHMTYTSPGSKQRRHITHWGEHLFNRAPITPGHWHFQSVYPPGPPDAPLEEWTVTFVPGKERFEAYCVATLN